MEYDFDIDKCPNGFRMFNNKIELKNLSEYTEANKLVISSQGVLLALRKSLILGLDQFECLSGAAYIPILPRDIGVYSLDTQQTSTTKCKYCNWKRIQPL